MRLDMSYGNKQFTIHFKSINIILCMLIGRLPTFGLLINLVSACLPKIVDQYKK